MNPVVNTYPTKRQTINTNESSLRIAYPPASGLAHSRRNSKSSGSSKPTMLEMPKRARTAYNIFFKMQQEQLNAARRQGKPVGSNSAAAISLIWKNLSSKQRAVYFDLAIKDKFRYYQEKKEYENSLYRQRKQQSSRQEEPATTKARKTRAQDVNMGNLVPEDWRLPSTSPTSSLHVEDDAAPESVVVPPYSRQAIALLASKLDQASIDFLVKALK